MFEKRKQTGGCRPFVKKKYAINVLSARNKINVCAVLEKAYCIVMIIYSNCEDLLFFSNIR